MPRPAVSFRRSSGSRAAQRQHEEEGRDLAAERGHTFVLVERAQELMEGHCIRSHELVLRRPIL
jgi:hypothetical protein